MNNYRQQETILEQPSVEKTADEKDYSFFKAICYLLYSFDNLIELCIMKMAELNNTIE